MLSFTCVCGVSTAIPQDHTGDISCACRQGCAHVEEQTPLTVQIRGILDMTSIIVRRPLHKFAIRGPATNLSDIYLPEADMQLKVFISLMFSVRVHLKYARMFTTMNAVEIIGLQKVTTLKVYDKMDLPRCEIRRLMWNCERRPATIQANVQEVILRGTSFAGATLSCLSGVKSVELDDVRGDVLRYPRSVERLTISCCNAHTIAPLMQDNLVDLVVIHTPSLTRIPRFRKLKYLEITGASPDLVIPYMPLTHLSVDLARGLSSKYALIGGFIGRVCDDDKRGEYFTQERMEEIQSMREAGQRICSWLWEIAMIPPCWWRPRGGWVYRRALARFQCAQN